MQVRNVMFKSCLWLTSCLVVGQCLFTRRMPTNVTNLYSDSTESPIICDSGDPLALMYISNGLPECSDNSDEDGERCRDGSFDRVIHVNAEERRRKYPRKKKIVFMTGNRNKLDEVEDILRDFYRGKAMPFRLIHRNVDLPELQGDSRADICEQKARAAYDIVVGRCMVEDTSLCFNAMGGLPGPYVKWFLKSTGPKGLYCMLKGFEDKSAMAVCSVAYVNRWGGAFLFHGETKGTIVEPRGPATAFGWDSIFLPDGHDLTYSQMSREQKNRVSHRVKAMRKLKQFLDKYENKSVSSEQ